jgi:hypothetical protein
MKKKSLLDVKNEEKINMIVSFVPSERIPFPL